MTIIERIKQVLMGRGVPEEEIEQAISELASELESPRTASPQATTTSQASSGTPAAPTPPASRDDQVLETIRRQMEALQAALAEERKAREEAVRSLQAQREREREQQIAALLEDAIKQGKVEPGKRDVWAERLKKDFDLARQVLEEMPAAKAGTETAATPTATPQAPPDPQRLMDQARAYLNSKLQAQA